MVGLGPLRFSFVYSLQTNDTNSSSIAYFFKLPRSFGGLSCLKGIMKKTYAVMCKKQEVILTSWIKWPSLIKVILAEYFNQLIETDALIVTLYLSVEHGDKHHETWGVSKLIASFRLKWSRECLSVQFPDRFPPMRPRKYQQKLRGM